MAEPRDVFSLFPTPVVVFDLPAMDLVNRALATELLVEEQAVPSWKRANVGGWHSEPTLSQRPGAPYRTLMRAIVEHVGSVIQGLAAAVEIESIPTYRYGVTSWAMIMRDGNYVTPHDHGESHWSIAYYVDAGDELPPPSGRLAFIDPRRSGRMIPEVDLLPTVFDIAPRTSSLVVFPGWLQHHVHAYRGQRPRICISANVTLDVERG